MNNNLTADSIEAVTSGLAAAGYIASRQIATAVYLAERIEKPILVEGPAGVGKTELAKALLRKFGHVDVRHVPRKENKAADAVVNQVLDAHR